MIRKLFTSYDHTDHVYTWDYRKIENAISLFETSSHFILATFRNDVDEETGAMGDFRDSTWNDCYVYSKKDFSLVNSFSLQKKTRSGYSQRDRSGKELAEAIKEEAGKLSLGCEFREVESIDFPGGIIRIISGDLIFEGRIGYEVEINFGQSEWMRYRPTLMEDNFVRVPIDVELPQLRELKKADSFEISSVSEKCEGPHDAVILFWIKERGEWIAVLYAAWNECGHTDESFDGPFAINEECAKEFRRRFNLKQPEFVLEKIRRADPETLKRASRVV